MASVFYCFVFLGVFTFDSIDASHKRAGIIMWKPVDPSVTTFPIELEISYRVAWRRNAQSPLCDQTTIAAGALHAGHDSITCRGGGSCSPSSVQATYTCTDFDLTENWESGANSYRMTVNANNRDFFIGYNSCCWIGTLQVVPNAVWSVISRINLVPRSDNGLINSSPRTTMAPIVRVLKGCERTVMIRTNDPDGDVVRCRNGNSPTECGGLCDTFSAIASLSSNCALEISAGSTGLYRATLILEDYYDETSTEPISSIPLQFIISVFDGDQPCDSLPVFVPDTPLDNQCIPFLATADGVEKTFKVRVKAGPKNDGTPDLVAGFITSSPVGVQRQGPIVQTVENGMSFAEQTFTWTPTLDQVGDHTFCITAESTNRIPSAERCFTLNVFTTQVEVPVLNGTEPSTLCDISSKLETFKFNFNRLISKPTATAYVRFFEIGNDASPVLEIDTSTLNSAAFEGNMLTVAIPEGTLKRGKGYYVTLDGGVVADIAGCGAFSMAVTNKETIRFYVDQCYEENAFGQIVHNPQKFIADCLNCERYLHCYFVPPISMPCPYGTRFNRTLGLCDHKGQTPCEQGPVSDDPCAFVDNGGIIKDPVECPKYIVCDHGVSNPKECPPGTIFSVITNVCEHSGTPVCPDQQTL